jgi:hypothetical protein
MILKDLIIEQLLTPKEPVELLLSLKDKYSETEVKETVFNLIQERRIRTTSNFKLSSSARTGVIIEEYIVRSLEERQAHLNLNEPCFERKGAYQNDSAYCRILLSSKFNTTIPLGRKIHACHACNNGRCSNISHIYWGTNSENQIDARRNGKKSIWERQVEKFGIEGAKKIQAEHGSRNKSLSKLSSEERSKEIKRRIWVGKNKKLETLSANG